MPVDLWPVMRLTLNTNAYGTNLQASMRNLLLAVNGDAVDSTHSESDTEIA